MQTTFSKRLNCFFGLILLFSCGCSQKWDPDNQFQLEVQNLKAKREIYKQNRVQEVSTKFKSNQGRSSFNAVCEILPIRELDLLMGYKYKVLAQTAQQGEIWERRQYYWEDIVEGKMGTTSTEYEICEKQRSNDRKHQFQRGNWSRILNDHQDDSLSKVSNKRTTAPSLFKEGIMEINLHPSSE